MNFANNNQPITTFPLANLPSFKSLGHQPSSPETVPPSPKQEQPDLMEAITTILDTSTWFEEKLEKRMEQLRQELKDDIEEMISHAVDDAVDDAIRILDINDHIDMREAVSQAVHEEINDRLQDDINELLSNADVSVSISV